MAKRKKAAPKLTELDRAIVTHTSGAATDVEMSLESRGPVPAVGGAEITGQQLANGGAVLGDPDTHARDGEVQRERDEAEEAAIQAARGTSEDE